MSGALDFLRIETATPLQLQVAALHVCSRCHKKTLAERHCDETYLWMQCTKCLTVFCLPFVNCCGMPRLITSAGKIYCGNCGRPPSSRE
jgi:hypothetical protein